MFQLHVIESSLRGQLRDGIDADAERQKENRDFLRRLMKELQCPRALEARAGVLDDNDIVGLPAELRCALRQVQNQIGLDGELPFFEFLHATVNRACFTVNEKNAHRAPSVGSCAARGRTPLTS